MNIQIVHDFAVTHAHAKEHRNGFVDRHLGEPVVMNAPGGERGDADPSRVFEFFTQSKEQAPIKIALAARGVEVDLDGVNIGQPRQFGDGVYGSQNLDC